MMAETQRETSLKKKKESFLEFIKEFVNESDRAVVVLGAAELDYLLAELIKKALLPSEGKKQDPFVDRGPLWSFSSRINAAYRFGLIDEEFKGAIHCIRESRFIPAAVD